MSVLVELDISIVPTCSSSKIFHKFYTTNAMLRYFIKVYMYSTYDFKIRSTSTRFGVSFDLWICTLGFSYASWKLHCFPYLDVKNTLCQITLQAKVDVVGNVVEKMSFGGLEGFHNIHKQFHQLVGLFVCTGTTLLVEKFIQLYLMIILNIWCCQFLLLYLQHPFQQDDGICVR